MMDRVGPCQRYLRVNFFSTVILPQSVHLTGVGENWKAAVQRVERFCFRSDVWGPLRALPRPLMPANGYQFFVF